MYTYFTLSLIPLLVPPLNKTRPFPPLDFLLARVQAANPVFDDEPSFGNAVPCHAMPCHAAQSDPAGSSRDKAGVTNIVA